MLGCLVWGSFDISFNGRRQYNQYPLPTVVLFDSISSLLNFTSLIFRFLFNRASPFLFSFYFLSQKMLTATMQDSYNIRNELFNHDSTIAILQARMLNTSVQCLNEHIILIFVFLCFQHHSMLTLSKPKFKKYKKFEQEYIH